MMKMKNDLDEHISQYSEKQRKIDEDYRIAGKILKFGILSFFGFMTFIIILGIIWIITEILINIRGVI